MHTLTLTIRRVRDCLRVIGEGSDPGLGAGSRVEESFLLEIPRLPQTSAGTTSYDALKAYGMVLGEAVFTGRLREFFGEARSRAEQAGEILHVLLAVEDAELLGLRWERLCARFDGDWQFLRLQQRTPFSFYLPSNVDARYRAIGRRDLKALVVVASLGPARPYGLANFGAGSTVTSIRAALGEDIPYTVLASDGSQKVDNAYGLPTLDEICERITAERPSILYVVCHGMYDAANMETKLYLHKRRTYRASDVVGPNDHVHEVSGAEFIHRLRMLQGSGGLPHLTFLCSCDSAAPEAEQGLGGLGQRLVRELGIPAVVAMTQPVAIDLAGRLSTKFYERFRELGTVDQALSEACAGVSGHSHVLVPQLYTRLAGRNLINETGPLTVGEWEFGLEKLQELAQKRAAILTAEIDELVAQARPALEIRKSTEHLPQKSADMLRADDVLRHAQPVLNKLCDDFLENSFEHLAKGLPLSVPDYDGRCPFPGLGVFDKVKNEQGEKEDFRPFFFGREDLTQKLLRLVEKQRFVAVLGGSGSGKSSLVRAGLLPEIRTKNENLQAVVFVPGKTPLARLVAELKVTPNPDVIVVDQFEEIFTLVSDDAATPDATDSRHTATEKRDRFLERLLDLQAICPIVITMRADFLGECAEHDELHQLLNPGESPEQRFELLQPLKGEALRAAMELQADAVKLQFEPGLAQTLFEEIEGEPGAMPLLQHCLRQLWQARHGRWLRLEEYIERVGGVKGAISKTAEEVYEELTREDPRAENVIRFIFERLARIDTDAVDPEKLRDTRRRQELSQLTWERGDPDLTKQIVARLADAKLLVTTKDNMNGHIEVEVAHEALIQNWKRLQNWLNQSRDIAHLVERLHREAETYRSNPLEENLTLRGAVLEDAEGLVRVQPPPLTADAAGFIRKCRDHEQMVKEAELRAVRELAEAESRRADAEAQRAVEENRRATAERRQKRIFLWAAFVSFALLSVATFFWNRSESERDLADERLHLSEAIRLSYESEEVAELYPQRSLLLAAEAVYSTVRYGDPAHPLAEQALRNALLHNNGHFIGHHDGVPTGMTVSPNTEWLAVYTLADTPYSSNSVSLWSLKNGSGAPKHYLLAADGRKFRSLTFTPESDYLLAATSGGTVVGWPLVANAPGEIRHLFAAIDEQRNFYTEVNAITLDPFGKYLVVAAPAGLWHIPLESLKTRMETTTQKELPATRVPTLSRGVLCVSYSSNGEYLAAGGVSGDVHLWRIDDDGRLAPVTLADSELFPNDTRVVSVAFQPDRDSFAAVGSNGEVIQWSLAGIENGHPNGVRTTTQGLVQGFGGVHIEFFDSKWLALAGDYPPKERELEMREVRVKHVNFALWETLRSSRFPIASGRTHDVLLTSGPAHDVLLWRFGHDAAQTPAMMLAGAESAVRTLEVSADGKWAFGASTDGNVFRWDIAAMSTTSSPVALGPLSNSFIRMPENCFTFVCDREESALRISRLTDRTTPVWRIVGDDRPTGLVSLAVDPTGKRVIAVSTEGRLYDYRRGSRPKWSTIVSQVSRLDPLSPLMLTFAFSATGSSLAVADFPKDQVTGSTTGKSDVLLLTDQLESDSVPVRLNCEGLIDAIEFSRDGNWLIASSIGSAGVMARLHGESHNSVSRFPEVERKGISAFAFAEDSSLLATIDSEGHTLLWNLAETREGGLKEVPCKSVGKDARTLAFIDKQLLVGTVGGEITLFDKNGTAMWTIQAHERAVSSLIVSPDRLCFVSTGDDKGSKMWRRDKSGEVIDQPIVVPWGSVIGFSSDSRWLITGKEGMLWKWQLAMDDLLLAAEDACYRSLTQEEFALHLPGYQFRGTFPSTTK